LILPNRIDNGINDMKSKLIQLVFIALLSQPSFACKCGTPKNVQGAILMYDYVFHGKAIKTQVVKAEGFNKRVWHEALVTFAPDTVFTGKISDTITIKYQNPMNACSSDNYTFKIGESYSIGVDKPKVLKTHTMENGNKLFTTNKSIQYGKVYPELDDCGFVRSDSISASGN
jgi:hypothetical protein